MTRPISAFYKIFIEPRSKDDDVRRRELILNVLLVGSLVLSLAALSIVTLNSLMAGFDGESPMYAQGAVVLFAVLYGLSRRGHQLIAAFTLVLLYLFLAVLSLASWGIILPEGLLILSLAVLMASVLLGTRYGLIVTVLNGVILIGLAWLQQSHTLPYDASWMSSRGNVSDAVEFWLTLGVIATVSWLSNREIERSLSRAQASEAELKRERDSLEAKVKERTRALELSQLEKIMELSRFAEFGRLTSSVVHELVTPLTTVSVNLEKMHDEVQSERLKRALESTKRMERYVESARKQLQNQSVREKFSPRQELASVMEFLKPEAQKRLVEVELVGAPGVTLFGNSIKFHQLATNLIANGISAYKRPSKPQGYKVVVELTRVQESLIMSVQDWGSGIPPQYIHKVFEPFFTLKNPDEGMGIGLSLCKDITENDFKGTLSVTSDKAGGTKFSVTLPITTQ